MTRKPRKTKCRRCGKELVEFITDETWTHFKVIELFSTSFMKKCSNSGKKFGVCLCQTCSLAFDEFLGKGLLK